MKTKFFGLGGMMEIGKMTLVIEHDDEIVIIDSGIKFASSFSTGVEGIIPDYSYLKENKKKIVALFITHGHEDHIGGVPYLVQQVGINKIYAPRLAIEYIKNKLRERKMMNNGVEFIEINSDLVVKSKHFKLDFWTSQHSIPDSFGIRATTVNGSIMYTGDFRFDYTPIGHLTDFSKLEQWGKEGLDILLSDSTNSMRQEHSPTEHDILADIEKVIVASERKTILTTFASNLNRVKAVIDIAVKHNKKVVPFGRSMVNAIKVAKQLKFIDVPDSTFIDKKEISSVPEKDLLILSTGSQGEEMAALSRMSQGKHPQVTLKHKDVIIFSSSAIPGNRQKIELLINQLYKVGATTKEHRVDGIFHTSGHAYKEEHLKIFELLKPKYFVPNHGQYRQCAVHGHSAAETGVPEENIILIHNGEVLELENHVVKKTNKYIDPGPIYIDGVIASKATSEVIASRKELGENGFINIVAVIDKKKNEIVGRTRVLTRGAFYIMESKDLINEIQKKAHGGILYTIKNNEKWNKGMVKEAVKKRIEPFVYKLKRRRPTIIVSLVEKPTLKPAARK